MKYKLTQKTPEEMGNAIVQLLAFLDENKSAYNYVDYQDGILVSVKQVELVKDSGIVTPPKTKLL